MSITLLSAGLECLGQDLMFRKMPITVLSARLNIKKAGE